MQSGNIGIATENTLNNSDVVVNNITNSASQVSTHDSIFGMFWHAGFMIKIVMLTLLFASIWSWTIIISKYVRIKKINAEADIFEDSFWSGTPLESLYRELKDTAFDPISNVFCAGMSEWNRLIKKNRGQSLSTEQKINSVMRIKQIMNVTITKELDILEMRMTFLSSLGTNAVIIGIFGTVLGIMEGMKVIATQQSASIIPIIAETLFTTAMGLVAAIPAAISYNKFSSDINRYANRLETFSEEFSSIISRQFDES